MEFGRVLVTGAGGFIGHHLVKRLKRDGHWVMAVDIKEPEYESSPADDFWFDCDLRRMDNCAEVTHDIDTVFNLAADMGGIGYITSHHATITRNNVLIGTNMLEAAMLAKVKRFLYTSSACVYPQHLQQSPDVTPLKEADAWPADPEKGYGLEKLFTEELCRYYAQDFGMETRTVRFHNIYGPLGTWTGGREKSPAAICRKVAEAPDGGTIEVWGDGQQTRSYCYVDDCVEGLMRLMASDHREPINLGTDRLVTIDELVDMVARIAGKKLAKRHDLSKPQGVRGRNSDNSALRATLGWEPSVALEDGLAVTYKWIESQVKAVGELPSKPDGLPW